DVDTKRARVSTDHARSVQELLAAARSGALDRTPNGFEDALFALVSLREAQTVRLLVAALDSARAKLPKPGAGEIAVARLAAEALGRLGIREGAIEALGRYLEAERDELRAARAGQALCRLGG